MNQTDTVIISTVTSLIVSAITFILGLKAGKNQTDRNILKEKYKQLVVHFEDIKEAINDGRVKTWSDYEHKNYIHKRKYLPLGRKMEDEGQLLDIKKNISKKVIEIEKDALVFGARACNNIDKINQLAVNLLQEYCINEIKESYNVVSSGTKNRIGISFTFFDFRCLYSQNAFNGEIEQFRKNENLNMHLVHKNKTMIEIDNLDLKDITISKYLEMLVLKAQEEVEQFEEITKGLIDIEKKINKLLKKLKKRAREPHTFWETFFTAFFDIFKVN